MPLQPPSADESPAQGGSIVDGPELAARATPGGDAEPRPKPHAELELRLAAADAEILRVRYAHARASGALDAVRRREMIARALLVDGIREIGAALEPAEARLREAECAIAELRAAPSPAADVVVASAAARAQADTAGGADEADPADEPDSADEAERGDWLRSALLTLAARDPRTAALLLRAILPACLLEIDGVLPFDLVIAELGLMAVSARPEGGVLVIPSARPRSRRERRFMLRCDAATLARLLAGQLSGRAISRCAGRPAQETFLRARRARRLLAVADAAIGFGALQRAGVRLSPELAYRALACAIPPEATDGLAIAVAHEVAGDDRADCYVTVVPGAGITVAAEAPERLDGTLQTSPEALLGLLAGAPPASASKPAVRGDVRAVEALVTLVRGAQRAA